MLEMSAAEVREYWTKTEPGLVELLDRLSRTEDWTLDGVPAIADRLVTLGRQLSTSGHATRLLAANRDTLLFFFVYISTERAFRLIRWLDDQHDMLGSQVLEKLLTPDGRQLVDGLIDSTLADVMVQRLQVLRNTPYFTRLFAPDMLDSIERVIEQYREEVHSHET
jgi:hypothetical protein